MIGHTTPPEDFESKIDIVGIFCEWKGKLLYLLKQDHKPQGNTWTDPGGKVDPGETPQGAIQRELFEETGIQSNDIQFLKTYYERYPDIDFTYHKFRVRLEEDPAIILSPNEHKAYAWFTPEEALKQDLIPGEDEIIRDIYGIE